MFLFTKLCRSATIISVDLPSGEFGGGYPKYRSEFYQRFIDEEQDMYLLREDSHLEKTRDKVGYLLGSDLLDFLFIDGDHTYEGVRKDFELYSPLVNEGGVIAIHDIAPHRKNSNCKVKVFWDEIKSQYKHTEIIEDKNQKWAGIGIIYK